MTLNDNIPTINIDISTEIMGVSGIFSNFIPSVTLCALICSLWMYSSFKTLISFGTEPVANDIPRIKSNHSTCD